MRLLGLRARISSVKANSFLPTFARYNRLVPVPVPIVLVPPSPVGSA